jgi:hypothetical protein
MSDPPDLEAIRTAVRQRIEATSLRGTAAEIGFSASGLRRIAEGRGSVYRTSRQRLEGWYRERGAGDGPRMVGSRWEMKRGELAGFRSWEVTPLGSTAYKMCRVAEGAAEGFVSRGPKSEWDVCAPEVIVREAGGRVTCLDGSLPSYNRPDPSWSGIACSNGVVHDELLRLWSAG